MTRPVFVYELVRYGVGAGERTIKGEAVFHAFGLDFEESDAGPGNWSGAIVEWPDGTLEIVPLHLIQFITPTPSGND